MGKNHLDPRALLEMRRISNQETKPKKKTYQIPLATDSKAHFPPVPLPSTEIVKTTNVEQLLVSGADPHMPGTIRDQTCTCVDPSKEPSSGAFGQIFANAEPAPSEPHEVNQRKQRSSDRAM